VGLVLLLLYLRKKGGPGAKAVQEERVVSRPSTVQMDPVKSETGTMTGDVPDLPSNW
jgi:hypothetical protein